MNQYFSVSFRIEWKVILKDKDMYYGANVIIDFPPYSNKQT